jgi:hypothetical protein
MKVGLWDHYILNIFGGILTLGSSFEVEISVYRVNLTFDKFSGTRQLLTDWKRPFLRNSYIWKIHCVFSEKFIAFMHQSFKIWKYP